MLDFNTEKTYDPKKVEDRLYAGWMAKGYFHAKADKTRKPFTIVIPPPNITGQLHMGHALDETQQDILIRMKRMQGFSTLWLPGTDHASIATEAKIVEALAEEGLTKEILGREKFLERAWEWKKKYGGRIVEQLKKLGSSCDWERERFTLDEGLSKAVTEVFIRLYNKGLIYRGERIINWCPGCNTSISDAEVEHEEKEGSFWHLKYPIKDSTDYIAVATTRPETMLGDSAVAVNPSDSRYKHLVGKTVVLPLMNREIPVIADEYVDMGLGTGAVKITPAHDPNDFEVGLRHNLAVIKVMNNDASMNENAGQYAGLDRYEARKQIIQDLQGMGLLLKTEPHLHNIGTCYRCDSVIEPMVSKQWFVKMKPLAQPALEVVKNGKVAFIPERFEKIYFNWMENIQDWCISRQLWWGHRIPAYFCSACGTLAVGYSKPGVCGNCGGHEFVQDEDTLDTWFSSALWPFSTLGWPENTEDFDYFYPTDVLVTSYDIIFFWVARMIFSGIEHTGLVPFSRVLIHGLVRDSQGRKMSKSLGNGLDPLEVIEEFGTDALRYSLTSGNAPGNDMRYSTEKIEAGRNFTNKIWNASRFVLMNFDENPDFSAIDCGKFTTADKWILSRLNSVIKEVTDSLENFEFGNGLQKIYEFIWEEYCDWYIELAKPRLYDREREGRKETQYVLNLVLGSAMKLLHPFMPFITEEIYQHLAGHEESIMISSWPAPADAYDNPEAEKAMSLLMDAIKSVRNIRAEMNVAPSKKIKIILVTGDESKAKLLADESIFFRTLAGASETEIEPDKSKVPHDAVSSAIDGVEIYIPLEDLIDFEKEIERLENEKKRLQSELERVDEKLGNEKFIGKAPEKIINEEKEKRVKYLGMFESVAKRLEKIKGMRK